MLPVQLSGLLSRLLAGNCPGSKPVWRNICKVGCGWFRYRVTMMKGFSGLECFRIISLVKVGCCKYCDKQITPTDRVSTCNTIDTVSCDCGVVPHRFILRIYWQCVLRSTASPPLGYQMQMGGYGLLGRFCYSPFAFDPI